jgi:hypothetical protein
VLLFLHRGDPEGSGRIANREIAFLLERGEIVRWQVPVMQRHWWNYFRVTHGVLAATTRRLLYVGVPPEALLPREEEPLELEELSWRYESPIEVQRQRVFLDTRAGVTIRGEPARATFAVASRNAGRLDSVLAVMERRVADVRAGQEAERRAAEAASAASRRPIYHLVQPGESLDAIARRYGTIVDSLRVWNGLLSDRIQAGLRLLVKPGS